MIEKCICCGEPISAYPCKFCGYKKMIDDTCPNYQTGICQINKRLCSNKRDYFNCRVLREASDE